jgi:hypothetical protein
MGSKQNFPDPTPYAQKGEGNSATKAGGQEQIGAPNTERSTKAAVIPCGEFTNDSSLDVPGDPTPYANESRNVAAREDSQADVSGRGGAGKEATGKTNPSPDALTPYGTGGDRRWS